MPIDRSEVSKTTVFAICEKCNEKLYLQIDLEEMKRKSKGGIFKVEAPHGGHSTIFFLSLFGEKVQVRGQVTGDSIVGTIRAPIHQQIPPEKVANIDTLLANLIGVVSGIECVFVLAQDGGTIGVKSTAGLPRVKIDMMEIMVHQILEGVTRSFDLTTLGTGMFEIGYLRFVVARAGPTLVLAVVSNLRISTEHVLAYSCLAAEKLWRILDGRSVNLDIPVLEPDEPVDIKPVTELRYHELTAANYLAKLTLVGDEAVGKTSLVRRFVENTFEVDYKPTLGVNISTKTVHLPDTETSVKFNIHDLAGQDQFARVRKAYFRGASACFIVFDVTNHPSFENVKVWYEQTQEYAGASTAIILLGNKIDLREERVVTPDEVGQLVRELGCPYIETSAKTGENVETAFSLISMYLCERTEERLKAPQQILTLERFLRETTLPAEISRLLDRNPLKSEEND